MSEPQSIDQSNAERPPETVAYTVTLPVFEGPLDLLLHLIERQQLDITAVSLAQVTGQYLAYLAGLQATGDEWVDANALADFLVMAAKLIWIKSRALLPKPPVVQEEEEDPAETLAQQLREYKRFKVVAEGLRARDLAQQPMYVRVAAPPLINRRPGAGEGSLSELLKAVQRALVALPPSRPAGVMVTPLPFTVHDKMVLITSLSARNREVRFRQLLELANSRVEVVITLLAVLELMKQRQISVRQETLFGEVWIAATQ